MSSTGNAELLGRTEHTEGLHSAKLTLLDLELTLGNERTDLGECGLEPSAAVGCAAHDLNRLFAVRHFCNVHVIGVRMRFARKHFTDDNLVAERFRAGSLDGLHLQTGTRQPFRKILGLDVINLNVLIQPAYRQLHWKLLLSSLLL